MTLKDTVRACLMGSPAIFKNAFDVYHHLFCVLGNGYEWENGELVSNNDKQLTSINEGIIEYLNYILLDEWHLNFLKKGFKDNMEKYHLKRIIDGVQQIMKVEETENDFTIHNTLALKSDDKFEFYPLCSMTTMVTFPDDIKTDWFEGIKKMVKIMEDNPEYLIENDSKWLEIVKKKIIEHESNNS